MPFETPPAAPRRIAVIGAGISGLAAAHLLGGAHRVTLLEAEPRLGGHARTIIAGKRGDQPVDTGFIVFNHVNYPNLTRMFADLDVPTAPSTMSFGASFDGGRFEYALQSLDSLFAQRSNILDPRYLRMLRDILRFFKLGGTLRDDDTLTVDQMIARLGLGRWFRDRFLLPFSGAIWSTPSEDVGNFPAAAMIRFFENHALLQYSGQHQWHTVRGGSIEYVRRMEAAMRAQGTDLRVGAAVQAVRRTDAGVEVRVTGAEWEAFDEVIFASHSDQTLAMLSDATEAERTALSKVRYQPNRAVLHADESLMPKRRKCWASWVYTEAADHTPGPISLTYWMNSLQPIPQDDPMFVTLNPRRPIREDLIYDEAMFHHPVYDLATLQGQAEIRSLNGTRNTWFCGAWMRSGFHEDGFASAVDVVTAMERRDAEQVPA
ncbi:NAD(P)/FAD-dependent oxidoreductase [Rhodobaculum claviforme]|uniref:Cyclopropane-fatty-acyl-phospholipid synthase n=1 Tax=Rhodobaculum claviforme TaxID=1549854 RepID=A0A934TKY4_9RHOB|nr:FAD-dependent oxidoreductase [Rhodobaculum claviforme]MBK5927426.1 cyclopropane-fatty-acyl-phospholipid synthase [Rhodobaculum claviforme]